MTCTDVESVGRPDSVNILDEVGVVVLDVVGVVLDVVGVVVLEVAGAVVLEVVDVFVLVGAAEFDGAKLARPDRVHTLPPT